MEFQLLMTQIDTYNKIRRFRIVLFHLVMKEKSKQTQNSLLKLYNSKSRCCHNVIKEIGALPNENRFSSNVHFGSVKRH